MDYLLFLKLGGGLLGAVSASVFFWCKGYSRDIEKPIEDAEGNFLISKVGELEGLESDGVILTEPEPVVESEPEPQPEPQPEPEPEPEPVVQPQS
jgi:hypothetical protein